MKPAMIAVCALTAYLVVYIILFQTAVSLNLLRYLYLASPLVVIVVVYVVLREKTFNYPELKEGEEWGYLDRPELKVDPDPQP